MEIVYTICLGLLLWCMIWYIFIVLKPRFEGNAFRNAIIAENPDNIHLGNMGYHLALDDEEKASEELSKHLKVKINKYFEDEYTRGTRK